MPGTSYVCATNKYFDVTANHFKCQIKNYGNGQTFAQNDPNQNCDLSWSQKGQQNKFFSPRFDSNKII